MDKKRVFIIKGVSMSGHFRCVVHIVVVEI